MTIPRRFAAFTDDELRMLWTGLLEEDGTYYWPHDDEDGERGMAVEIATEAAERGVALPVNRGNGAPLDELAARDLRP